MSFKRIPRAEIVIFDKAGSETLEPCLPSSSQFVIHVRGEIFHADPLTQLLRIYFLLRTGRPYFSYFCSLVAQIRPKVLVTFIDNTVAFHELSNTFPEIRFMAIQNGWRFPSVPNHLGNSGRYRSTFFCFGENEVINYRKRGVEFARTMPVGSLKNSISGKACRTSARPHLISNHKSRNLAYISQFRPLPEGANAKAKSKERLRSDLKAVGPDVDVSVYQQNIEPAAIRESERLNVQWLLKFQSRSNQESIVDISILRASRTPEAFTLDSEWEYFAGFGVPDRRTLKRKSGIFDNYESIRHADVVISSGSTLALEALGMGKRVLITQPVASQYQAPDFEVPWWQINLGYDDFSNSLKDLLCMTDKEFSHLYAREIKYLINQDASRPTYELVRSEVAAALEE